MKFKFEANKISKLGEALVQLDMSIIQQLENFTEYMYSKSMALEINNCYLLTLSESSNIYHNQYENFNFKAISLSHEIQEWENVIQKT